MREPFIFLCSEITRENAFTLIKWLNDHDVMRYLSDSQTVSKTIEQVIDRVNLPILTHLFNQDGRFYMAYNKQNIPVGFVRFLKKGTDVELVIVIGDRNNWGKKLGTATIRESMKVAFFDHRAEKIIAKIHRDNKRSIRAFLNTGFTFQRENSAVKVYTITINQYLKIIKGGAAMPSEIYITEIDKERLKKIINDEMKGALSPDKTIQNLMGELNKAKIVEPQEISGDVITMNSRALLHFNEKDMEVSLVYPGDADWGNKKLSIFSPIGTAILGYKEGDTVEWEVPSGVTKIHIKKILYQPEAAGDFHM